MLEGTNPYQTPSTPIPGRNEVVDVDVPLPLELRPSGTSLFVASGGLLFFAVASSVSVLIARNTGESWASFVFWVFGVFGFGIGLLTCFSAYWCRIQMNDSDIVKNDILKRTIPYTAIESWRSNSATKTIHLFLINKVQLTLSNWSLSRTNHELAARVLHQKVGPPDEE